MVFKREQARQQTSRRVGSKRGNDFHTQLVAAAAVSISSGQRNLMKTYHNDANTSGMTKIALKKILDFF